MSSNPAVHLGQLTVDCAHECNHGQYCGDCEIDPGGDRTRVNPETHEGQVNY